MPKADTTRYAIKLRLFGGNLPRLLVLYVESSTCLSKSLRGRESRVLRDEASCIEPGGRAD